MITARAVETLLVSVLAWMSIQASVTLAALLTAILLPWALLSIRRTPGFAWMTLALVGMTWRAEAWKTVYLKLEQQVSEQQSLQQPRVLPKIGFCYLVQWPPHADVRCEPPYDAIVFRHESEPFDGHRRPPDCDRSNSRESRQTSRSISLAARSECSEAYLARFLQHFYSNSVGRSPREWSVADFSLEKPLQSDPTPIDFI